MPSNPLIVTSFINSGQIQKVREMARVHLLPHIVSYSGFFTVNQEFNSNLFFWYFRSKCKRANAPLLLWLNGFKVSCLHGVFEQSSSYTVSPDGLETRPCAWDNEYNVLYIDSVVGVGFSFADVDDGLNSSYESVGDYLSLALVQFYQLFPELIKNDFYIGGMSYAGKYVVMLAHRLTQKSTITVKGIIFGNTVLDTVYQHNLGAIYHSLGFIDHHQLEVYNELYGKVLNYVEHGMEVEAVQEVIALNYNPTSVLSKMTGLTNFYNIINPKTCEEYWIKFVQQDYVREALHVGNLRLNDGTAVYARLFKEGSRSQRHLLENILRNGSCKVMVFGAEFDGSTPYKLLSDVIRCLDWPGQKEFDKAQREFWMKDGKIIGYIKNHSSLTEVFLRRLGHEPMTECPLTMFSLLQYFIENKV